MKEQPLLDEPLPGILGTVAEVAGETAALLLAKVLGGSRVSVPRTPRHGSLLVEAVGLEAARKIADAFGGENITVPLGPTTDYRRKRSEIRRQLEAGRGVQEIARDLHCHFRTVIRVKQDMHGDGQPDLFATPRD